METWSITTLLLIFGGGIVGAAFGALWSIILCALIVLVGCGIVLAGGSDFFLLQIGLGPIFGPMTGGFTAGLAAATYAAGYKKNHPGGSAKDILSPLIDTSWDVMAVGGVAAVLGWVLLQLAVKVPILNQADGGAIVVCGSAWITRILFYQEGPLGNSDSIARIGWLKTDNYAISWAPWQSIPSRHMVLGLGVGFFAGAVAIGTGDYLAPLVADGTVSATAAFLVPYILGWAIAIIGLIPLNLATGSIQKMPIFHAMALLASLTAMYTGSIVLAGIVGLLAAMLQELCARMFHNHASNHLDPPATAILIGTLILNLLFKPEFFNLSGLFK